MINQTLRAFSCIIRRGDDPGLTAGGAVLSRQNIENLCCCLNDPSKPAEQTESLNKTSAEAAQPIPATAHLKSGRIHRKTPESLTSTFNM